MAGGVPVLVAVVTKLAMMVPGLVLVLTVHVGLTVVADVWIKYARAPATFVPPTKLLLSVIVNPESIAVAFALSDDGAIAVTSNALFCDGVMAPGWIAIACLVPPVLWSRQ